MERELTDEGLARVPTFTESDARLLAALIDASSNGRPVNLRELVHDVDFMHRLVPSFDEVSFGLQRLVGAGYVKVALGSDFVLHGTPKAVRMGRSVEGARLEDLLARSLKITPGDAEDRSLGRLDGLTGEEYEMAVAKHREWVEQLSQPFVEAARDLIREQGRNA